MPIESSGIIGILRSDLHARTWIREGGDPESFGHFCVAVAAKLSGTVGSPLPSLFVSRSEPASIAGSVHLRLHLTI